MRHPVRIRFFIESAFAALTASSFLLVLIRRDWIEALLGSRPDHGDGSLELAILIGLLATSCALVAVAGLEWRKRAALMN